MKMREKKQRNEESKGQSYERMKRKNTMNRIKDRLINDRKKGGERRAVI
jgi:hypothetical protein